MELHAGFLERQAAEFQQFANPAFRLLEQRLVAVFAHVIGMPRRRARDAAVEIAPEAGQVVERARVAVARIHALAVAGEARLHRVAATYHDASGRQHRANRADVDPVVGQFVDEDRPLAAPARGSFEIALAEARPVRRLHLGHPLREHPAASTRLLRQHLRQVRQFAGALHGRMRSEDLLHQGGAGSGQADDEDHLATGLAGRRSLDMFERIAHRRDLGGERRRVPRLLPARDGVGRSQCIQGAGGVAGIVQRLGQRKPGRDAVLFGRIRTLEGGAHLRHVGLGEWLRLQIGKPPPCHALGRPQLDQAAVLGTGRVDVALCAQHVRQQRARGEVVRGQRHGSTQRFHRFFVAHALGQHDAQVVPGQRQLRQQLTRRAQRRDRRFELARVAQQRAHGVVVERIARPLRQGPLHQPDRRLVLAAQIVDAGLHAQDLGVVGMAGQHRGEQLLGVAHAAGVQGFTGGHDLARGGGFESLQTCVHQFPRVGARRRGHATPARVRPAESRLLCRGRCRQGLAAIMQRRSE